VNRDGSVFSKADIRAFEREARRLNVQQNGDQATFILRRG
jgi:hypothetical protein